LKKRTKKLLVPRASATAVPKPAGIKVFLLLFVQKKKIFPRLGLTQTAPIFGEITKT
jgi:hypothetical protein